MEAEKQESEEVNLEPVEAMAMSNAAPTCPSGYYWNATLGKCVLDVG